MQIALISPAELRSRSGNRTTAVRWARLLRELGHRVNVHTRWDGAPGEMMIALHAWRSAESIVQFRQRYPQRPLVVALTGTDVYRFQASHKAETHHSMELADILVCLHAGVKEAIPSNLTSKLHVIHQSAPLLPRPRSPSKRTFDICVIGHLREEKDPFRTAYAVRDLAPESRLRVLHLGRAHSPEWAADARAEMACNHRYHWLGEVPGWRVRREFIKTHLMVLSSIMEGGANVISEALVAGVPVIASRIDGNVGLLGEQYPGYFSPKSTAQLRKLLVRAENDSGFVESLNRHAAIHRPLFTPERETAEWQAVLKILTAETR